MSSALSPGGYVRQGQRATSPARSVNVQVAVRCRPLNDRERTHGERSIITCEEDRREVLLNASAAPRKPVPTSSSSASVSGRRTFTYDHVFSAAATQADVYNRVVEPIVDEVLQGYNCTVFAYGQTGTGKTHTMEGCRQESDINIADRRLAENAGIIPRAVKQVFDHLRSLTDEHSVRVSHLELYNEQLTDLLSPDDFATDSLRVYEDPQKGTFVQGLEDVVVRSEEEIFAILDKSAVKRKTAETLMNKYSSRSHSIFSITIHIKESTPDGADLLKVGKLNLVDLAGSENVGRSGAVKGRAREAGNINQSLLTLGRVITALVDRHPHVPYRDSKLTRLLQESLGGRNKTCIIATVTPGSSSVEETASTLDYAYRAKSIKNRPTVNQMIAKHVLLKEYTEEIAKLKRELDATREKNGVYLLPDEYDMLQQLTKSQSSQISDLQQKSEENEEKMSNLRGKLEKVQIALQRDQKILDETRKMLSYVTEDLRQTQLKLAVRTRERDENIFLMRSHETTENQLFRQGQDLQDTLSTSLADVSALHDRVDLKSNLEIENTRKWAILKNNISQEVSKISERLDVHRAIHDDITNTSIGLIDKAKKDLSTGMELMMTHLEEMEETLALQDDGYEQNVHDGQLEFEQDCNASTSSVRRKLVLHGSAISERKTKVDAACQAIREVFEESAGSLTDVIAFFETHKVAERERLSSLLHQQQNVLSRVEGQVAELVSKQKDMSEKMMSNNKQGHEDQMEALRFSKKAIIDRISLVMDELIGNSMTNGTSKHEEDQKLADEIMAAGSAANDTLKATHDALEVYSTNVLSSSDTASGKILSSLYETGSKHKDRLECGRNRVDNVETVIRDVSVAYDDFRGQCEQELKDLDLNIESFGKRQQTCVQDHKQRHKETVKCFVGRVMKSKTDTCEASWKACDEVDDKTKYSDSNMKELTTSLEGRLSRNVKQTVQNLLLEVDQNADKVPPKRQWPAHAMLAKTRDHHELLAEFRNGVATRRESEGSSRDALSDTKDDTMSDAEKEGLLVKEKRTWYGSDGTESYKECSEVEDERESIKDADNSVGLSVRRRRVGSLDGNESVEKDEVTKEKKSETGSDASASGNGVLSDLSNRRIMRPRSVRRIEPVIRKQTNKSAIPVPRSRTVRRLGGVQQQQ